MKKLLVTALLTATVAGGTAQVKNQSHGYPIDPVPFTSVKVTDSFWGQRLNASREVTIPLAFSKCEETGRYTNFVNAAHPSDTIKVGGLAFDDTDVYKTIEGASYLLQTYPDKKLAKYIDSVLVIVAAAQEPDGYLYTSRTMNPKHPHEWAGSKRWEKVEELSHEFYNLGHMVEGAIAHYQATGKRNFLDIAIRYADCVCREIGTGEGQQIRVPGHQIAEMALAKLCLVTGQQKYLDQAKFFLDQRGHTTRTDEYSQAHKPVVEQDEAVGHAVRAAYMYAGMADVAALTGDTAYIHAIDRIWDNIVGKKYYITGGIGATSNGEAFGKNYELPNMSAYCETCAAIGNVYVNYRLFLLHGEAKYYDVLERTLYNNVLTGISLSGTQYTYQNPLNSAKHARWGWHDCPCCPPMFLKMMSAMPGFIYSQKGDDIYVNLFIGSETELSLSDQSRIRLTQKTGYPWDGSVVMTVEPEKEKTFLLKVRIPGWAQGVENPYDLYRSEVKSAVNLKVNGKSIAMKIFKGYAEIQRKWKKGDRVELTLPVQPRLVTANEAVADLQNKVAIAAGPFVYCLEGCDNEGVADLRLDTRAPLSMTFEKELLNGVNVIKGQALDKTGKKVSVSAIPYYALGNRQDKGYVVWMPANK